MNADKRKRQLRAIAKKLGYKTRRGDCFSVFMFGATITVDNRLGPRVWEWRMLHELGHAELFKRRERNHMRTMIRIVKPGYVPTEAFYRDYLEMEWKAWEQGMKIAKREGFEVNEKQYWRHARKCWMTYVEGLRESF